MSPMVWLFVGILVFVFVGSLAAAITVDRGDRRRRRYGDRKGWGE
jgi:hypothetical protein